jgi:hypothetical protein
LYPVTRCLPASPRLYRYCLELRLSEAGARLAVVLKNPSTATAERSDPTVGKVSAWARRRGFGSLAIVNLFGFRTAAPAVLNGQPYARAVGPENDAHILDAARWADVLVAAWGNPNGIRPGHYRRRIAEVAALLSAHPVQQVGPPTLLGYPRHGLRWTPDMRLTPFDFSGRAAKLPLPSPSLDPSR